MRSRDAKILILRACAKAGAAGVLAVKSGLNKMLIDEKINPSAQCRELAGQGRLHFRVVRNDKGEQEDVLLHILPSGLELLKAPDEVTAPNVRGHITVDGRRLRT